MRRGPVPAMAAMLVALSSACASAPPERPDFTGVWSGVITTQDDPFWRVEDFSCFLGCSPGYRQALGDLLDDPANDARPVNELTGSLAGFQREELAAISTPEGLELLEAHTLENDPNIECQPYGLVRASVNPLPLRMRAEGGNLVIDYEEWNQSRTIYMDGRDHPADGPHTRLGHSVGRYEGDALVIDSANIAGDVYHAFQSGGAYSDQATVVERYTIHESPRRLVAEVAVTDPVTLTGPHRVTKMWLWTPDIELVEDRCGERPGEF